MILRCLPFLVLLSPLPSYLVSGHFAVKKDEIVSQIPGFCIFLLEGGGERLCLSSFPGSKLRSNPSCIEKPCSIMN